MIYFNKLLPINEVYPCIQGEGRDTGIPMIMIRFTGCRLRCQFTETSFCDTHYSSWSPEKGKFSLNDIFEVYKKYPHIKHTLISGGGPTLYPQYLATTVDFAKSFGHYVCIETEGSEFVKTDADFISLSPKLKTSNPKVGTDMPWSRYSEKVTQTHLNMHNKYRQNYDAMNQLLQNHKDFQLKPVYTHHEDLEEIQTIIDKLSVKSEKVWLMPQGQSDEEMNKVSKEVVEICLQKGWNYSHRLHINIYGKQRGV